MAILIIWTFSLLISLIEALDESENVQSEVSSVPNGDAIANLPRFLLQGPSFTINLIPIFIIIKLILITGWLISTLSDESKYSTSFETDSQYIAYSEPSGYESGGYGIARKDLEDMAIHFVEEAVETFKMFSELGSDVMKDYFKDFGYNQDYDSVDEEIVQITDLNGNDITNQVIFGKTYNREYNRNDDHHYQTNFVSSYSEDVSSDQDDYYNLHQEQSYHDYYAANPDTVANYVSNNHWQEVTNTYTTESNDDQSVDNSYAERARNYDVYEDVWQTVPDTSQHDDDHLSSSITVTDPDYGVAKVHYGTFQGDISAFTSLRGVFGDSFSAPKTIHEHQTISPSTEFSFESTERPVVFYPKATMSFEHPANSLTKTPSQHQILSGLRPAEVPIPKSNAEAEQEDQSADYHYYENQNVDDTLKDDIVIPRGIVNSIQDILRSHEEDQKQGNPKSMQKILHETHHDSLPKTDERLNAFWNSLMSRPQPVYDPQEENSS